MIFYYFFTEYKENVYKKSRRKLVWFERLMFGTYLLSTTTLVVFTLLKFSAIFILIPFAILLLCVIIIYAYTKRQEKNRHRELLKNHKDIKVGGLIELLKDKNYNLHSTDGINWLIQHCQHKLNVNSGSETLTSIEKFFATAVYPIITLVIGLSFKDISVDQRVINNVVAIVAMLIFVFAVWRIARPTLLDFKFPDKAVYQCLCEDLEYIKTQLVL